MWCSLEKEISNSVSSAPEEHKQEKEANREVNEQENKLTKGIVIYLKTLNM